MKFGVFYELQLPLPPWARTANSSLCKRAHAGGTRDKLGYDYAWEVEHHFLRGVLPLFRAGGIPRGGEPADEEHPHRTRHHPASDEPPRARGRACVDAGPREQGPRRIRAWRRFKRDRSFTRSNAASAISGRCGRTRYGRSSRCLRMEGFGYHGEYFDFPLRNVVPKPLQKPHRRSGCACSQLDTIEMAGRRGIRCTRLPVRECEAARAWVSATQQLHQAAGQARGLPDEPGHRLVSGFMCAETDEQARKMAEGWTFFQFSLMFYNTHGPVVAGHGQPLGRIRGVEADDRAGPQTKAPAPLSALPRPSANAYGSSKRPAWTRSPAQPGRKNTHEDICSSLELFAREVMPEFHDREPEHQAWKQKVLSGEIQLEEIDTSPFNVRSNQTPTTKTTPAEAAS